MESWMPLSNIRFVERAGQRILQQAWGRFFKDDRGWQQSDEHEWRDVAVELEDMPWTASV